MRATPTVLQFEAAECALAALAMLLSHHGCAVDLEELRQASGVSRDGTRLSQLRAIAAQYGFHARVFKKELDALAAMPLPAMVFINFNHMVVIESVGPDGFLVNDPACGHHRLTWAEMDRAYTGIALILEPTAQAQSRPPRQHPSVLPPLSPGGAALVMVAALVVGVGEMIAANSERPIGGLVLTAIAITAVLAALHRWRRILAERHHDWGWHHLIARHSGYLINRSAPVRAMLLDAPEHLAAVLTGAAGQGLLSLGLSVLPLSALALTEPVVAAITALAITVTLIVQARTHAGKASAWRRSLHAGEDSRGLHLAHLSMLAPLQVSGRDDDALIRIAGASSAALGPAQERAMAQAATRTFDCVILAAALAGAGLLAAPDQRLATLCLTALAVQPVLFLPTVWSAWFAVPRLQAALADLAHGPHDHRVAAPAAYDTGGVRVAGLCFGYGRCLPPLLADVNLTVLPGMVLALTGPAGCGKTTLAALIAGQLEPWQGNIVIGGTILLVPAAPLLFAGTVADNVGLWDQTIPTANLEQALRDAALWDEVSARGGLSAPVAADGDNWSGGQRRRLMLARALARAPQVVVIDESLDGIDRATEDTILATLRQRGTTVILITQRAASAAACDHIVALAPPAAATVTRAALAFTELPAADESASAAAWTALAEAAHWLGRPLPPVAPQGLSLVAAASRNDLLLRPLADDDWPGHTSQPLLVQRGPLWRAVLPDDDGRLILPPGLGEQTLFAVHRRDDGAPPPGGNDRPHAILALFGQWSGWMIAATGLLVPAPLPLAAAILAIAAATWAGERALARWQGQIGTAIDTGLWGPLLRRPVWWLRHQNPEKITAALTAAAHLRRQRGSAVARLAPAALMVIVSVAIGTDTVVPAGLFLLLLGLNRLSRHWLEHSETARAEAAQFRQTMLDGILSFRQMAALTPLYRRWRHLTHGPRRAEQRAALCDDAVRWLRPFAPLAAAVLSGLDDPARAAIAALGCVAAGIAAEQTALLLAARDEEKRLLPLRQARDEAAGGLPSPHPAQPLALHDVWFSHGERAVLRGVSLCLAPGEIVALCAPSGAGKTTLLDILMGFQSPQLGFVSHGGHNIATLDRMALRRHWGAVLQDEILTGAPLHIHLGGFFPGSSDRAWDAARLVGLDTDIAHLPMGMATPVSTATLSAGQAQKVMLGRALIHRPTLLVLDEALSALDTAERTLMIATIRRLGTACMVVTHDAATLALCDRVLGLQDGRIVENFDRRSPLPPLATDAAAPAPPPPPLYRQKAIDLADGGARLDLLPALSPPVMRATAAALAALIVAALALFLG